MDLGRANPLLTYLLGILLGGTVASTYISEEGVPLAINLSFMLVVLGLIVIAEISYYADED